MNLMGLSELNPERLTNIFEQYHQEIYENWRSAMRQKWTGWAEKKLSFLEQKIAGHQDFLSLLRVCSGKTEAYYQNIISLINLDWITSQDYSVLDVFDEIVSLEDSILNLLQDLKISGDERKQLNLMVHKQILTLLQGLLYGTKELLSCLIDGGMRGYCQVDEQGRIICADQEFQRLLNRKPSPGEPFDQLFVENDRDVFTKVFSARSKTPPGSQRLHLDSYLQGPILVGTELCPLVMDGQRRGWYACLVDLSAIQKKELEVYGNLSVGLAQVDLKGKFRYVNPRFSEILGTKDQGWQGKNLWDFLPDKKNREKVESEIEKRRQGIRGEYEATFTQNNGYKVPVKIYSVPEKDLQGNIIGSLAIVRSQEREKLITAMVQHMTTIRPWPEMFKKVAQELAQPIPFDFLSVSEVGSDSKHIRRLYSYSPTGEIMHSESRWVHVADKLVNWIKEHHDIVIIDNLEYFLSSPEWQEMRDMDDVQKLIHEFHSCIRYPVVRDRVLASVNLFHRQENFYTKKHQDLLEALPLDKVVLLALDFEQEEQNQFHADLIRNITSVCDDLEQVIKTIVDQLAKQYQCDVALFQADERLGCFRLLYQKAKKHRFPKQQPFKEGILGYVFETREDVNVGDVREDPKFNKIVKLHWKDTHSEIGLYIPTPEGGWLLNIKDDKKYLLSPEEFSDLQKFRDELAQFLERILLYHSLKVVWAYTSDAIIRTDREGNIEEVNPAAAKLLGYTRAVMQGRPLGKYFQDAAAAERVFESGIFLENQDVTWKKKDGSLAKVLLSASSLPKPFRGKIFTAKDLKPRDQAEKLKLIGKLHQEIATQIKTPLSLIFAWLSRLQVKTAPNQDDTVDKVLKQLHKVELTCDRLSLYDDDRAGWVPYHEILLDSYEIVEKVLNMFPEREREKNRPALSGTSSVPARRPLSAHVLSGVNYILSFAGHSGRRTDWADTLSRRRPLNYENRGVLP